jgi:hypothetical protein
LKSLPLNPGYGLRKEACLKERCEGPQSGQTRSHGQRQLQAPAMCRLPPGGPAAHGSRVTHGERLHSTAERSCRHQARARAPARPPARPRARARRRARRPRRPAGQGRACAYSGMLASACASACRHAPSSSSGMHVSTTNTYAGGATGRLGGTRYSMVEKSGYSSAGTFCGAARAPG